MRAQPLLGAHVSIAGGMPRAIQRGEELGCDTLQVFVKNASQWKGKVLADEEVATFRLDHQESRIGPIVAHATYLVNLAATSPQNLARSRETLGDELDRCDRLGIRGLVVHPGAHLGAGEEAGLDLIAESVAAIFEARVACRTRLLLEITAGQGTVLGYTLEQLAAIRDRSGVADRLGLCIDTCHAFAAGYELTDRSGWEEFIAQSLDLFPDGALGCIHVNDSRHPLGSRKDRHANLGKGEIGRPLFEWLVSDPRLEDVPLILETPLGNDGQGHARDLDLLKRLLGASENGSPTNRPPD